MALLVALSYLGDCVAPPSPLATSLFPTSSRPASHTPPASPPWLFSQPLSLTSYFFLTPVVCLLQSTSAYFTPFGFYPFVTSSPLYVSPYLAPYLLNLSASFLPASTSIRDPCLLISTSPLLLSLFFLISSTLITTPPYPCPLSPSHICFQAQVSHLSPCLRLPS